jgi:hypothetical protein
MQPGLAATRDQSRLHVLIDIDHVALSGLEFRHHIIALPYRDGGNYKDHSVSTKHHPLHGLSFSFFLTTATFHSYYPLPISALKTNLIIFGYDRRLYYEQEDL